MGKKVVVYSKPGCGLCTFTKKHLDGKSVEYDEVNIAEDPFGLSYIKSLGYSGLPVVEFGDFHFNGFNPVELDKIAMAIKEEV